MVRLEHFYEFGIIDADGEWKRFITFYAAVISTDLLYIPMYACMWIILLGQSSTLRLESSRIFLIKQKHRQTIAQF